MQRLTHFIQGHQRVFLDSKQQDIHKALLQALKELKLRKPSHAAATTVTAMNTSSSTRDDLSDVQQGVQRQNLHTGRKYPSFGKAEFGDAYEPWSDDMACILQGSCLPGSTRYCRTISMFGKMDLNDIMQATTNNPFSNGGKRQYHTSSSTTLPVWSLNSHRWAGSSLLPLPLGARQFAMEGGAGETKEEPAQGQVSQRQRLKMAVRDYGSTVVVFHVCISLMSLGGFYLAVTSGIDVQSLLSTLGFSKEIIESKIATGTSTFVMAYAVHKVFAPVRIAITLTCTPFIVRYLRGIGLLKRAIPTK